MKQQTNSGTVTHLLGGAFFIALLFLVTQATPLALGQPGTSENKQGEIVGTLRIGEAGIQRTTVEIMADPRINQPRTRIILNWEFKQPDRSNLPEAPGALLESQWPRPDPSASQKQSRREPSAPQTVALTFNAVTGPTETGAFPPDTMGVAGPTQFFAFLNGRLRTFNKTTGVADGVINADPDVFFASVITPPGAGEVSFTSDPNVRYDRLSSRWFLTIIDVTLNTSSGAITRPNRILIAVSNTSVLTGSTVWTFFRYQADASLFADYPSLGIDANALYIGADMFTLAGAFSRTDGHVIRKSSLTSGGPIFVTGFTGLVATPTGAGPFAPRGVDNDDPGNTGPTATGYFIGVDNATFNTLMIRRVTDPAGSPTISANISVATPLTTRFPVLVPHLGNTGGTGGRLDSLDDRLYAAVLRNGRLWTAHNIGVNNTGVAGATNNRCAARWYELQNLGTTPSILQSGTLFDNNAINDANQRNYWIPSITVTGQGHAALGCSIAGTNERINAFTTGRLIGDTLGTLEDGPGGAALPGYTASSTAYNPPGDPGGPSRRWGDYSFTSVDPNDNMTIWTIQEYCNGTNTYGCRVAKLLAPPPATPASTDMSVQTGQASVNVVVTGTVMSGSGFYDPGAAFPNRIGASVTGGVTVNSVTFTDPTHVTLDLNTTSASPGNQNVTITNPDGQMRTGTGILIVTAAACNYTIAPGTDPIVMGLTDTGNHCDDCDTNVALPFAFQLYGQTFTSVNVNSNGRLDFVTVNETGGFNTACLPAPPNQGPYDKTIFGLWEDMRTDVGLAACTTWANGCGIFTSTSGAAPNRIFNIEWHTVLFNNNSSPAQFEVRLYENPALNERFDVIYGPINTTDADHNYVGGVQNSDTEFTQDFCTLTTPPQNVSRTYTRVCATTVTSAVSRKTHGGAGAFDIALPLTGTTGVECRSGGGTNDFTMVVTFTGNVTVSGSPQAQVISGAGIVGSGGVSNGGMVTVAANVVTIPLTNVTDQQTINVRLNGVNNAADVPAVDVTIPMSRLLGDSTANRSVNAGDITQVKSRSGQAVTAANFRSDLNANGSINAGDIGIAKANTGHGVP